MPRKTLYPMKKLLFAVAASVLLLSGLPRMANADVSVDFFYDNLAGGSWFEVEGYGYCWQPDIAMNDSAWRPYADGYWAYTDVGWTWISYEDFGWATYHYGRWARLADYGWVWVPGSDLEWGPAWVSWRTGGDYIGWAPLPPRGPGIIYEGGPIGATVDVEFDIGPEFYNFCDVRYIGEPVLRQRIVPVQQNITYINQTVNITNITVNNNVVYNHGPDINVVNQHSSRPIQRLRLERQENVDVTSAVKGGGITKVQGDSLVVAAPMKISKPTRSIAPPQVKAKVESTKMDRGWKGVDPNEQARIKQQIKTEDRTKVPPFGAGGRTEATGQAGASASPAAAGTPAGAPGEKGPRGRGGREAERGATTAPVTSPSTSVPPAATPERGRGRGRGGQEPVTTSPNPRGTAGPANTPMPNERRGGGLDRSRGGVTPSERTTPAENATPNENLRGGGKRKGPEERTTPAPMDEGVQGGTTTNRPTKDQNQREGRHRNIEEGAPGNPPENIQGQGQNTNPPGGGKPRKVETPPPGPQGPQTTGAETPRGDRRRPEGVTTPAGGAAGSPAGERRHEAKEKASPSPGP